MFYLNREDAIKYHRDMWRWIATETLRKRRRVHKFEYLDEHGIDPFEIHCQCFCCEYVLAQNGYSCKECIIEWGEPVCCRGETLFDKWTETEDYKKAALLAYRISKLPERKLK